MDKKRISQEEIEKVLAEHLTWLLNDEDRRGGAGRANLSNTDLSGLDLDRADLESAILSNVNFCNTYAFYANLKYADLSGAIFKFANLQGADLRGANLRGADIRFCNLRGASLPTGFYQIVGLGSGGRCTTYDSINDCVVCGCWDDEDGNHLAGFKKRIEDTYGEHGSRPNSIYYDEYMEAIKFFESRRKMAEDRGIAVKPVEGDDDD